MQDDLVAPNRGNKGWGGSEREASSDRRRYDHAHSDEE